MKNLNVKVNVKEIVEKLSVIDVNDKNGGRLVFNFGKDGNFIWKTINGKNSQSDIKIDLDDVDVISVPDQFPTIYDEANELPKIFNLLDSFDVETAVIKTIMGANWCYTISGNDIGKEFWLTETNWEGRFDSQKTYSTFSTFTMDLSETKKTRIIKDFATLQKVKASNDAEYPTITCIDGKVFDNTLELASIDGFRLATKHYEVESKMDENGYNEFTINNEALTAILKVLRKAKVVDKIEFKLKEREKENTLETNITVRASKDSNPFVVTIANEYARDVQFFDYTQIQLKDEDKRYQFKINQKDLLKTLNNFKPFYAPLGNNLIISEFNQDGYTFDVDRVRKKLGTDIINNTSDSKFNVEFGINGYYLLDAVNDLEGTITITSTGNPYSPIIVDDASGKNEHLILPIRIND